MLTNVWHCESPYLLLFSAPTHAMSIQHIHRRRDVTCVYSGHLFVSQPSLDIFSAIYVGGIMFYKLGLELFNGSITTLATDRFQDTNTFTKCACRVSSDSIDLYLTDIPII